MKHIARLASLSWKEDSFVQNWALTGATGSAKTRSGIFTLAHQVFQNVPHWGGLWIDDKGDTVAQLRKMARHYGRERDLVVLEMRKAGDSTPPPHRMNILGDASVPAMTYAQFIVDVASMGRQQGEQPFFRKATQLACSRGIEALRALEGYSVTLDNLHQLLCNPDDLATVLQELDEVKPELAQQLRHEFVEIAPDQKSGVVGSISNVLGFFRAPEISEVFCSDDPTVTAADFERGKILCVVLPQERQAERRTIQGFLKSLFYLTCLRRYDHPTQERPLLILWADEFQRFVSAQEDGMSDVSMAALVRGANATLIVATQSTTSLSAIIGPLFMETLMAQFRNRLFFTSPDQSDAEAAARTIGKHEVSKVEVTEGPGGRSRRTVKTDEFKVTPDQLRKLPKHRCIIVHAEHRIVTHTLPPLEADGSVAKWFPWWRRLLRY